jgi:hypothetical protein
MFLPTVVPGVRLRHGDILLSPLAHLPVFQMLGTPREPVPLFPINFANRQFPNYK